MKGIYKAIIGIATTGAVATAGIVTANVLSENKETKPVAIVNEMGNTVNEENKIEENIVDNSTENNIQDNNSQKNNTNNKQPVTEVLQETVKSDENIIEEPVEKEVVLNLHLKRNVDTEESKTYTIIVKDDIKVYEENVIIKDKIDLAINLKGYETTHRIHVFINDAPIAIRDIDFKTQSSYDISFELYD